MATAQQQWRRGSQLLLLVALVLLIAAGSADASCSSGYSSCGGNCYNLRNNPSHCGSCGNVCHLSSAYRNGEVYCSGGGCGSRCRSGWHYNSSGRYCYQ